MEKFKNSNVSALFVRADSIYKQLGIDCWDVERNALNFSAQNAVICHPPCRAWGRLYKFAKPSPGEKDLALFAVDLVRKNGGVLEHPAHSKLWKEKNLPVGSSIDEFGGWTLRINQHWFGHLAQKDTFLYIVGCSPSQIPSYPLNFSAVTHVISTSKRYKHKWKECSVKQREATPVQLAEWLILLAQKCYNYRLKSELI